MSDYEKALALHDYICENVVYSDTSMTAYEALVNGRANCQGYAEATGLLYTLAGLENHVVRATNKHTDADHGYVKVKIDGTWYVVDTTADDPMGNSNPTPRHDFFLVSDEILETRYTPWLDIYPDCNSMTLNYYQVNDLVVSSSSELSNLIREAVKDKKSCARSVGRQLLHQPLPDLHAEEGGDRQRRRDREHVPQQRDGRTVRHLLQVLVLSEACLPAKAGKRKGPPLWGPLPVFVHKAGPQN